MENISPIIFFIIYMAISAWAKQRKAQAKKAKAMEPPVPGSPDAEAPPKREAKSIFEQIKEEILELQEEARVPEPPAFFQNFVETVETEPEPVMVQAPEPVVTVSEGSDSLEVRRREKMVRIPVQEEPSTRGTDWEQLFQSYSPLEQGILFSEILGKPRSLQDEREWFHST